MIINLAPPVGIYPGPEQKNRLSTIVAFGALAVSIGFSSLTVYFQFFSVEERLVFRVNEISINCYTPVDNTDQDAVGGGNLDDDILTLLRENDLNVYKHLRCHWTMDAVFINPGDVTMLASVTSFEAKTDIGDSLVLNPRGRVVEGGKAVLVGPNAIVPANTNVLTETMGSIFYATKNPAGGGFAIDVQLQVLAISGRSAFESRSKVSMSLTDPRFREGIEPSGLQLNHCYFGATYVRQIESLKCGWLNDGSVLELDF